MIISVVILDLFGITFGVPPDVNKAAEEMMDYDGGCIVRGVISERNSTEKGYSYILEKAVLTRRGTEYEIGRVRINSTPERIKAGTEVKIYGRLSFYEQASNPGGFDARRYYLGEGVFASLSLRSLKVISEPEKRGLSEIYSSVRERLTDTFNDAMGQEAGGIMSAMATGDRSGIDKETRINYSVSGLSHLLAISGLHIGIIGAVILSLLLTLGLSRVPATLLAAAFLFFYCTFTGGRESTVRAFVMFAAASGAVLLKKSYDSLSALSLAGIILMLINPYRICRPGFILSFAAAAGLAVIYPGLRRLIRNKGEKSRSRVKTGINTFFLEGLLVWISVNAATIPAVLWNNSEFPVYSAAANILLVPLTEFILLSGIAGGAVSFILPAAGKAILSVPCRLISLQEGAGRCLRSLPGSVWITGQPGAVKISAYYAGLIIILILISRKRPDTEETALCDVNEQKTGEGKIPRKITEKKSVFTAIAACIMMSLIFIRMPVKFSVTALDVGQGDAIVMTSDSGKAFMIDGGSSSIQDSGSGVILPYLKNRGIAVLEGVFISHNDSDHLNGIAEMLRMSAENLSAVHIKRVFMPVWMKDDPDCADFEQLCEEAGAETVWLKAGDSILSSGIDIKVLSPDAESGFTGNEGSLVLGIKYDCFSGLFTGDLGGEAEDLLTARIGRYSILKAGHHGSAGSTSSEFLEAVRPDFCIISAPRISSYGHPAPEMIKRLESAGIAWIQTGRAGAVTIKIRKGRLAAEYLKKRPLRGLTVESSH